MSAVIQLPPEFALPLHFAVMEVADLPAVMAIEDDVYPHPWTRGNFLDSLKSGYQTWVLRDADGALLGYFLLMLSVDEAHLLNISVRGDLHGHGLGRYLLAKVIDVANENILSSVLLEVRPTNRRALAVYERFGFIRIGVRKKYYPAAAGQREDAIVMRFSL
ncbi:ribosomal-protein-alanine N-acetyltransferase [Actimicrobium sp. GrIS 1.19]|nr:ribosomal-protein-alanine N-acetyltransferase [Actimicrobium sp. GrIS 1.19]